MCWLKNYYFNIYLKSPYLNESRNKVEKIHKIEMENESL